MRERIRYEKERERGQKALEESQAAAEAANKAKTDFLFNMSHDIRTPMNAIIGYADLMEQKKITFTRNIDVTTEYYYGDQVKLSEIFLNIISNSYKYTDEGGRITLSVKELPCEKEGYILLETTVEDTGIGMSEEFLPRIFEEFAREHTATETKIQGTGLGMPIVKKLVDLMGGSIEVESEIETEVLSELGLVIEHADDGLVCIDMLSKAEPGYYDLILMDVQMPNLDGYGATKRIRMMGDKKKAQIPIIAMTANAFEEDRQNALAAGMDGHLAKPIEVEKMIEMLAGML